MEWKEEFLMQRAHDRRSMTNISWLPLCGKKSTAFASSKDFVKNEEWQIASLMKIETQQRLLQYHICPKVTEANEQQRERLILILPPWWETQGANNANYEQRRPSAYDPR